MFPWIKIPDKIYDAAIEAFLKEEERQFGKASRLAWYASLSDGEKEKWRRLWRVSFSTLLREWL
jgi:hypothetical protein